MDHLVKKYQYISLSDQEKEHIYNERFSYGGKVPYSTNTPWDESQERYSKIVKLVQQNGLVNSYNSLVEKLRGLYSKEVKRLGVTFSEWGDSDTWIEWDICKQLYFYLNPDGINLSPNYRIANPLEDKQLQQEIVNRHIGWEYWGTKEMFNDTRWDKDAVIIDIMDNEKYRSSFNFPKERSSGREISSWGLELLGKRVRELG